MYVSGSSLMDKGIIHMCIIVTCIRKDICIICACIMIKDHGYMHHGLDKCIIHMCIIVTCIRIGYASYMHVSGSRIMDTWTCIMHTWTCILDTCIMDTCIMDTCITDTCTMDACIIYTYITQWIHASWTHLHGSHGLSARRARRTKSRRPEGPQNRSWGPEGPPKLLVSNTCLKSWSQISSPLPDSISSPIQW